MGDPFVQSKYFQKKSHSAEKSGAKGGHLVCFRDSGRVLFFPFVLDALLRTSIVQVVEQMNKKWTFRV